MTNEQSNKVLKMCRNKSQTVTAVKPLSILVSGSSKDFLRLLLLATKSLKSLFMSNVSVIQYFDSEPESAEVPAEDGTEYCLPWW